jgi:shikimate kinase
MIVTLIGYRGTGKSTVAEALAARICWAAVDADEDIEAVAGKSVEQIFADDGEAVFRRLEREVMARLLNGSDRLIIAAGGGAILDEQTRKDMQAAGPVIWLTASIDTILRRINADPTTLTRRPNLTERGGRAEVEQTLTQREPLYREVAGLQIDTENRAVHEIVEEICAALTQILREGAAG